VSVSVPQLSLLDDANTPRGIKISAPQLVAPIDAISGDVLLQIRASVDNLIKQEERYLEEIHSINEEVRQPLLQNMASDPSTRKRLPRMFFAFDKIIMFHTSLIDRLKKVLTGTSNCAGVGEVVLDIYNFVKTYQLYASNYEFAVLLISELKKGPSFRSLLDKSLSHRRCADPQRLEELLLIPLQHVSKYPKLVKKISDSLPRNHRDSLVLKHCARLFDDLEPFFKAFADTTVEVLGMVTVSQSVYPPQQIVAQGRRLLMECHASVMDDKGKLNKRCLFFFNNLLLETRDKIEEPGKPTDDSAKDDSKVADVNKTEDESARYEYVSSADMFAARMYDVADCPVASNIVQINLIGDVKYRIVLPSSDEKKMLLKKLNGYVTLAKSIPPEIIAFFASILTSSSSSHSSRGGHARRSSIASTEDAYHKPSRRADTVCANTSPTSALGTFSDVVREEPRKKSGTSSSRSKAKAKKPALALDTDHSVSLVALPPSSSSSSKKSNEGEKHEGGEKHKSSKKKSHHSHASDGLDLSCSLPDLAPEEEVLSPVAVLASSDVKKNKSRSGSRSRKDTDDESSTDHSKSGRDKHHHHHDDRSKQKKKESKDDDSNLSPVTNSSDGKSSKHHHQSHRMPSSKDSKDGEKKHRDKSKSKEQKDVERSRSRTLSK